MVYIEIESARKVCNSAQPFRAHGVSCQIHPVHWERPPPGVTVRGTHMCCCVSLGSHGGLVGRKVGLRVVLVTCHKVGKGPGPAHSWRAVWQSPRVVYGQAARARRLFCNQIYNYNCKLTLSAALESRSYGISINYRSNLRADVDLRTIDHMIDSGARQGRESNETNAASVVEYGEMG